MVVRAHIMAHGFGCDELLLHQLRHLEITKEQLHQYLHFKTKLASFRGLRFLHVDIEDVEYYVTGCLNRVTKAKAFPRRMLHYVPPQLFLYGSLYLEDGVIDQELTRAYRGRFGLSQHEINLALGFFSKQVPVVRSADLASPRLTDRWVQPKSASSFLGYEYPNGHKGVYPLDTND